MITLSSALRAYVRPIFDAFMTTYMQTRMLLCISLREVYNNNVCMRMDIVRPEEGRATSRFHVFLDVWFWGPFPPALRSQNE